MTVYNATGCVAWTATAFSGGGEIRAWAVEDIDREGQLEIIVGEAGSGATKQVTFCRPTAP